jgi:hypothetical protein
MSPVFAARRRAEEFQALVEGTSTGRDSDARYAEFLELVQGLRETVPVTARPEFVAELREQLLDEARTLARTGKGADVAARLTVNRSPSAKRRERRLAAAVGGLAIVGASTGMAVAAQSALPGDPLYPLKRAIENAQTGVQVNEDAKGKTLLENASGRLEEVDRLSRESDDAETVAETLQAFTDQASEASDLLLSDYADRGQKDSVEQLRDFTAQSMAELTALEGLVPEDARASLIQAAQTLNQIDQQALISCPSCGPETIAQIPPFTNVASEDLAELLRGVTEAVQNQPADQPPKAKDKKQSDDERGDGTPVDNTPPTGGQNDGDGIGDDTDDTLVDDLVEPLTGKTKDQDQDQDQDPDDDDAGLLENLTEGLGEVTGGLLGN